MPLWDDDHQTCTRFICFQLTQIYVYRTLSQVCVKMSKIHRVLLLTRNKCIFPKTIKFLCPWLTKRPFKYNYPSCPLSISKQMIMNRAEI